MNSRRAFFRSIEIIVYTYQNSANLMMRIFAFVFSKYYSSIFEMLFRFSELLFLFLFFDILFLLFIRNTVSYFFFRNTISFYRDIISIYRITNSFYQNKILFHRNYSEWLLLNANSAIFQLYHKLIFNEMMMRSALY